MDEPTRNLINAYDPSVALPSARTIPSAWYTDAQLAELERRTVFSKNWIFIGRTDQLDEPGKFFTADVAGAPIVALRDKGGAIRAFHNVCRHHAAAVVPQPCGIASTLQCPYHGWTYALDGSLKGMTEFDGVRGFDKSKHGLLPVAVASWEEFIFVRLSTEGEDLPTFLGDLAARVARLDLGSLRFFERREYDIACNWKVFVDNYLDGGYHVPHAHKSLNTVLDYQHYTIECADRSCEQSSPLVASGDAKTASVRRGDRAYYYWLHPNFMLNWYEGVMDINVAYPISVDRTRVVFDFYFSDTSEAARDANVRSLAVAERVQDEDIALCESVQRGLQSVAYDTGRLSVRREAGEHLFHRCLYGDLTR